jgi:chromosome segregation ATPase
MDDIRSKTLTDEPDTPYKEIERIQDSLDKESFSFPDGNSFVEIELQANQLLDYIDKLSSLADRACHTAIRQTESAQRIEETRQSEIDNLRKQLEQSSAALQERNVALAVLEKTSHAHIVALEKQLHDRELQLSDRENDIKELRAENSWLADRLNKLAAATKTETVQADIEPLSQEIAELKLKLAKRDETIQAKNGALQKIDLDFRSKILELEQRLQDSETKLLQQEAILKEKDALLQATAAKEVEIGKLIKRLSAECDRLNTELQEKTRSLTQSEPKKPQPTPDSKVWRRVIGRFQEESS